MLRVSLYKRPSLIFGQGMGRLGLHVGGTPKHTRSRCDKTYHT